MYISWSESFRLIGKFRDTPNLDVQNSPVSFQDRTGYEVMQQGHVEQMMAGWGTQELKVMSLWNWIAKKKSGSVLELETDT